MWVTPLPGQTTPPPAASATAPASIYGAFPTEFKALITAWLETQLLDASSARIEWVGEPKPADLPAVDGTQLHGYRVDFKVNSRNRFGSYTGMQRHGVLIHDGQVIKGIGFGY